MRDVAGEDIRWLGVLLDVADEKAGGLGVGEARGDCGERAGVSERERLAGELRERAGQAKLLAQGEAHDVGEVGVLGGDALLQGEERGEVVGVRVRGEGVRGGALDVSGRVGEGGARGGEEGSAGRKWPFSLTPALSRWERGRRRQRWAFRLRGDSQSALGQDA